MTKVGTRPTFSDYDPFGSGVFTGVHRLEINHSEACMKACIRSVVWMESAAVLKTFSGLLDEKERWFLVNDWSSITRRFRRIPQ